MLDLVALDGLAGDRRNSCRQLDSTLRIALRQTVRADEPSLPFRRAAQFSLIALACASAAAAAFGHGWTALALITPVAGYSYDLRCQQNAVNLQLPLKKVGQRALALSSLFAALLIVGLW